MWPKMALSRASALVASSLLVLQTSVLAIPAGSITPRDPLNIARGINCKGSIVCTMRRDTDPGRADSVNWILDDLNYDIEHINKTRIYKNDEWIACRMSICAFLQDVPHSAGPLNGSQIQELMYHLHDHGCHTCGSVPLSALSGGNDDTLGMLTLNFVAAAGFGPFEKTGEACGGLCYRDPDCVHEACGGTCLDRFYNGDSYDHWP